MVLPGDDAGHRSRPLAYSSAGCRRNALRHFHRRRSANHPSLTAIRTWAAGTAALLITLPTVSLPTLTMLARALPLRTIVVLGLGTFVFGLLAAAVAVALGIS